MNAKTKHEIPAKDGLYVVITSTGEDFFEFSGWTAKYGWDKETVEFWYPLHLDVAEAKRLLGVFETA